MRLDSIMNASIRNRALLKVAADGPDASKASSSRQAMQRTHLTNKTSSGKFNKNPGIRWVHWCAPWMKNGPRDGRIFRAEVVQRCQDLLNILKTKNLSSFLAIRPSEV